MKQAQQKNTLLGALMLVGLYVAFGATSARADWQPWSPIGEKTFDAALSVKVQMPQPGKIHLLAVGKDRQIYTNTWQKQNGWQGWQALGDLKLPAKAPVEVLMRRDNGIDRRGSGPSSAKWRAGPDPAGFHFAGHEGRRSLPAFTGKSRDRGHSGCLYLRLRGGIAGQPERNFECDWVLE